MSLRLVSRTMLVAALCVSPLHVALADDANAQQQPTLQAPGDFGGDDGDGRPGPPPPRNGGGGDEGDQPGPPPPRNGGGDFGGDDDNGPPQGGNFGGGRGDFGGNFGGPRQDGFQGGFGGQNGGFGGQRGGFGGQRGVLGPAFMNFDASVLNETSAQRSQRVLQPYLAILPTLSAAQQTHILAILDAASAELRAANADTTLTPEQRASATRYLRSDLSNRVALALTPAQLTTFNAQLVRQTPNGQGGGLGNFGNGGPGQGGFGGEGVGGEGGESPDQQRARILTGYEDVMDELSVKQKTDILAILRTADAQSTAVRSDTTKSVAAKTDALQKIHDDVNAKVLPLLDADQVDDWKKAHAAKRLELAKLAATPLPASQQTQPQQGPGGPQPGGFVGF